MSAYLAAGAFPAWSQKAPPASSAPAAPAGPATQSAAPAGITNGSLPIESTILAYKILTADAAKIDQSLSAKTAGKIVVVGTSADIAAIVQLRIVLSQASVLEQRLQTLTAALRGIAKPVYANPVMKGNVKLGAGFIASPADVATLIQTLGSITAVNETLSSASGALSDATLISLIAQGINADAVYTPSAYPPNLITDIDTSDTYIGAALIRLEAARRDAVSAGNDYLQALKDADKLYTHPEPVIPPCVTVGDQIPENCVVFSIQHGIPEHLSTQRTLGSGTHEPCMKLRRGCAA